MPRVRLSADAQADLDDYRAWLLQAAGEGVADAWTDGLLDWIAELRTFPERGSPRPDLRPGIRTRVFRRRVTIAYAVVDDVVTVLRVFGRGRNVTTETLAERD